MLIKFLRMLVLCLFAGIAPLSAHAAPADGKSLYAKHCGGCHPNPAELELTDDFLSLMRVPPAAMPAFREERLADSDVRSIEAFMRKSRNPGQTAVPTAATAVPQPAAGTIDPVQSDSAPASLKQQREKKPQTRRFIRNWTIKTSRNGETVTVQKFEITSSKSNELNVIPAVALSDYTAKVTAFEVADNKLKLELTWSWKNSLSYRKTETYLLTLAEDGKKMVGTYKMQASGDQTASMAVWAD